MFIERNDLVIWRRQYLKAENIDLKENKYLLVCHFLTLGHTVKNAWRPTYIKSETMELRNIPWRGRRLIVVHTGS